MNDDYFDWGFAGLGMASGFVKTTSVGCLRCTGGPGSRGGRGSAAGISITVSVT